MTIKTSSTHEIFAVSPWSENNRYRNIQAEPALEVETGDIRSGRVRNTPVQRSLTPKEIAESFVAFRSLYPVFSSLVARTLRGVTFVPKEE